MDPIASEAKTGAELQPASASLPASAPRSESGVPGLPPSDDSTSETQKPDKKIGGFTERLLEDMVKTNIYHDLLQKHRVPPSDLEIPMRMVHPEDWNWHFEQVYKRSSSGARIRFWRVLVNDVDYAGRTDSGDLADLGDLGDLAPGLPERYDFPDATKAVLVAIQADLIPRVQAMLAEGAFEQEWAAMEKDKQIDVLLKALVSGADVAGQRSRADCSEMSLLGLLGERKEDGEEGLLSLLTPRSPSYHNLGRANSRHIKPASAVDDGINGRLPLPLLAADCAREGREIFQRIVGVTNKSCEYQERTPYSWL
ncbi:hypothetical protein C8F01DRAFT_1237040 [Mycena amicta]|nr:hypothetical protein C8F01DRAFT_1237040 [Mycena amicta]